jgi:hypothetical protein
MSIVSARHREEGQMTDPKLSPVFDKLAQIVSGGCTCGTKTPELEHHVERCHYRLASEVLILLCYERRQKLPFCEKHQRWPCKECGTAHFPGCQCFYCR